MSDPNKPGVPQNTHAQFQQQYPGVPQNTHAQFQQQYPGPPEYVEQGYPMQPSYGPSLIQYHGMPQPYGMVHPTMLGQGGYPPGPMVGGLPYASQAGGYPPPIMQQPHMHPFNISDGFYVDSERPIERNQGGDPQLALDYLKGVRRLEIRQKIELLEIFTNFETPNKYTIFNEDKQPVLFAAEMSDCCVRQCCGSERPMEMVITDVFQTEVIHLSRPLRCQAVCFPCCLQVIEVSSPPGSIIGSIEQNWSLWPSFSVKDVEGTAILMIEGPFITSSCCCQDVIFRIVSAIDNSPVGEITKKYSGFTQEYFSDADNFEVAFPEDLDVFVKATLIGAVFLIDMMYYESPHQRQSH